MISISLLLFLVGFFALMALGGRKLSNYFKENVRVVSILKEDATEAQATQLSTNITLHSFVKASEVVSKEQGTQEMKEFLGEDFLDVFESNPIPITINIFLKPEYLSSDSIKVLKNSLLQNDIVEDVVYQEDVITSINSNIKIAGIVSLIFISLLLFVSIVLINNTVRLNIFSRRFAVHTMKLVGATPQFIMKPFLYNAVFQGIISAFLAIIALIIVGVFVQGEFNIILSPTDYKDFAIIALGLILLGVILCFVCTWIVVRKMVSMSVNDLYY